MSNVLVFGHQNPDNDAIMSSVVLSQLLNQVEFDGNTYQACCLGPLPAESAKLLEDNGVAAPSRRSSTLSSPPPRAKRPSWWFCATTTSPASPSPALRTP